MFRLILVLALISPIYAQAQYVRDVSEICGVGKKGKRLKVLCQRWRRHDRHNTGTDVGGAIGMFALWIVIMALEWMQN